MRSRVSISTETEVLPQEHLDSSSSLNIGGRWIPDRKGWLRKDSVGNLHHSGGGTGFQDTDLSVSDVLGVSVSVSFATSGIIAESKLRSCASFNARSIWRQCLNVRFHQYDVLPLPRMTRRRRTFPTLCCRKCDEKSLVAMMSLCARSWGYRKNHWIRVGIENDAGGLLSLRYWWREWKERVGNNQKMKARCG